MCITIVWSDQTTSQSLTFLYSHFFLAFFAFSFHRILHTRGVVPALFYLFLWNYFANFAQERGLEFPVAESASRTARYSLSGIATLPSMRRKQDTLESSDDLIALMLPGGDVCVCRITAPAQKPCDVFGVIMSHRILHARGVAPALKLACAPAPDAQWVICAMLAPHHQ